MHDDLKWFFGLLLAFGFFWFVGIMNKGATDSQTPGLPSSNSETSNGGLTMSNGGNYIYTSSGSGDYNGTQGYQVREPSLLEQISWGVDNASRQANDINRKIDAIEISKKTSPLSGKLYMSLNRGSTVSGEYAIITASSNNTEKILITGLRIQSEASGNGANIPKGVALYYQNQVNKEEPIYLAPGESAYVITGRSPLGASFKLNKCTGFFSQYQNFFPSLPNRCPRPTEFDLPKNGTIYNDACKDYINSLPSCRVITNVPQGISGECTRYVTEEISYFKCVNAHKNDRDFYDPIWMVYLNRDDLMYKSKRETIHLVDSNGKIIYVINY